MVHREIDIDSACFQRAPRTLNDVSSKGDVYMQLPESDLEDLIEAYLLAWNAEYGI